MPSGNVAPVTQQPPLRSTWLDINLQVLLRIVAVAHVVVAPYTKVEESFNVQAVHDWLFLGLGRINEVRRWSQRSCRCLSTTDFLFSFTPPFG